MEPLSKFSLNNQIVSMRHIVRKSKVHTIHKLTREAKKLKEKKGSEEQIVKNQKKSERFINELMVIKKLNDDDVTKYALQNEVPSATILNSTDITLETRALAKLVGHKFIMDEIQNFRNKYPDWKLCITDLLDELGVKYRAKKKSNKNKTIQLNNVKNEVKTKILDKNNKTIKNMEEFKSTQSELEHAMSVSDTKSESEDSQSESVNTTETESSLVQKILIEENNTNIVEDKNMSKGSKVLISNNNKIVGDEEECLITLDKNLHHSQLKTNILNTQLTKKNLDLTTNEILKNTDINIDKNVSKRKAEKSVSNKTNFKRQRNTVNEVKPVCETVDSFFMTTDNKDYMSVYKPPPVTKKNIEEQTKIDYQKPIKEIFNKGKRVIIGKQNNISNRRERRQQQVEESIDMTLHPSWEAKRKQKSLAKFEGKKITFDDED
ncbi:serum response factor-binding protein 1-like [Melanaphis sacchari]|uniref:serum response factor-binding protein 1-like n=1 Tax=Melanaphis sacchari TaxID=742174 RepID=UPI000DC156BC|nr:serum response factor-binding protein 1-like [Melanaphis sacchari]XP_025201536.1 serum response factor-binding protein 1-like [Melanaphis sacchari]